MRLSYFHNGKSHTDKTIFILKWLAEHSLHAHKNQTLYFTTDTVKLTSPRILADKRGVGPVKLLCITMFDMSKIRAKSWSSKSPKVFMVSVTIIGNFYCISWEYSQNKKEISRIHSYSIVVSWVEIVLDLKLDHSMQTTPIPWQLMHWLLVLPGHQLSWYWLCKIGQTFSQLPRIRIWTICAISEMIWNANVVLCF